MPDDFKYDVFLSHSSKDKPVVRELANRLKKDKLRVWFDEWELKPGDRIPAKIEEGLESSRVLVLCMSANAFGSEWAQLEAGTFRFRDPLNKERRFIPLRLDDAPIKGPLAQFLYINWRPADRKRDQEGTRRVSRTPIHMIYSEQHKRIVDYLGTHQHLAVDIDLSVDKNGGLRLRSGAQRFYEGPIAFSFPLFFSGIADVCEWYDQAIQKYRIAVNVHNRTWGRLFGYRGAFDMEWKKVAPDEIPDDIKPRRLESRE
jgi:hypothetical protein